MTAPPQLSIDTLRTLAIDAVQAADSGHAGMPMGCAPMAYLLFHERMRHDPADPRWWARDRFVLSAGHGSMLLYGALHLTGYEHPTLDEIRDFRQLGSPTAGHPEADLLPGVETTTGPLGQGFAAGVGMALAAERLSAEYDPDGRGLFPQRVYAICSDGDLMEGVASEAASFAGHHRLGRLVYLYDDNEITIDGDTSITFDEDVEQRFRAYGWHVQSVEDGNDLDALRAAVEAAEQDERPSIIHVRTVIGYGSPNLAGTADAHSDPLGEDEVAATKQQLDWPYEEPFTVPDEVTEHMDARSRGAALHQEWHELHDAWAADHPERAEELARRMAGELPDGWQDALPAAPAEGKATRASSGEVINALAPVLPELFGGAADLAASNKTDVEDGGSFEPESWMGRNIHFGVREHGMAAIANGMARHGGFRPYVGTFLIFTDYAKGGIRIGALMEAPVIWVATHDSVALGEDGPTHQPIGQLAGLRATPHVTVLRPADAEEVVGAWAAALQRQGPVVLSLTRQGVPAIGEKPGGAIAAVARGGYVLRDVAPDGHTGDPDILLVATGSEVHLAVEAAEQLAADGTAARVVSLPSWELFAEQDQAYRDEVLPPAVRARVSVEAGATLGWERFVGLDGEAVGIDRFGTSAPGTEAYEELGFTTDAVLAAARRVLSS